MPSPLNGIIERFRPKTYGRRQPLVLINGLAEQAESWYRNRRFWGRFFEVYTPNILAYEGEALHRRIAARKSRFPSIISSNNCTHTSISSCRRRRITWCPAAWAGKWPSSSPPAIRSWSTG